MENYVHNLVQNQLKIVGKKRRWTMLGPFVKFNPNTDE